MNLLTTFCVVFFVLFVDAAKKLPSTFKLCSKKQDAKKLNECLRTSIQDAIGTLVKRDTALGLPIVEPMVVPSMTIGEGRGTVHIVQKYKNIQLIGLSALKITKLDAQIDDYKLYLDVLVPKLTFLADYDFNGRILVLPLVGQGKCNLTLTNVKSKIAILGEPFEKNGETYAKFNFTVSLAPENVDIDLDNLFNGDKRLADPVNVVLKENSKEVFQDVQEGYETAFGIIFADAANKIFTKVPYKDIFID